MGRTIKLSFLSSSRHLADTRPTRECTPYDNLFKGSDVVMFKLSPHRAWPPLVLAVAAMPWAASAQTVAPAAPQDWRSANEAVGGLPRGHRDVLKWESAHPAKDDVPTLVRQPQMSLLTADDVIRQAWRAHRDLARPLAQLGDAPVALMAAGRWVELDARLQRRVDDIGEVLEVAAQARKAWLQAVAARQSLAAYRTMRDSTEAASELGQRMVSVGNWSPLKQAPLQLAHATAKMNAVRAHYADTQAQATLINTLGLKGQVASVALPERLPDVPLQAVAEDEWRARALRLQNQWPRAAEQRHRTHIDLALAAYQASHALVMASQEALKVREFISEETVLRYNGMLSSSWDVLNESRNQAQASLDAIAAQRDFWLAERDLQWVLQGGEPANFVSLGGGGEAAAAAAAH